jgi:hypothetical protein
MIERQMIAKKKKNGGRGAKSKKREKIKCILRVSIAKSEDKINKNCQNFTSLINS